MIEFVLVVACAALAYMLYEARRMNRDLLRERDGTCDLGVHVWTAWRPETFGLWERRRCRACGKTQMRHVSEPIANSLDGAPYDEPPHERTMR